MPIPRRFVHALAAIAALCAAAMPAEAEIAPHQVTDDAPVAISAAALDGARLLCVWTPGDADTPQTQVLGAYYSAEYDAWFGPRPMVRDAGRVTALSLHRQPDTGALWLFTAERDGAGQRRVLLRTSDSGGAQWSQGEEVYASSRDIALGAGAFSGEQAAIAFTVRDTGGAQVHVAVRDAGETAWTVARLDAHGNDAAPPVIAPFGTDGFEAYAVHRDLPHRHRRARMENGGAWTGWEAVNLPNASPETRASAGIAALPGGDLAAAGWLDVTRPGTLALAVSHDGGRTWPIRRTLATGSRMDLSPALIAGADETLHVFTSAEDGGIVHHAVPASWINAPMKLHAEPVLAAVAPPLTYPRHRSLPEGQTVPLPMPDTPFHEHVRRAATEEDWPQHARVPLPETLPGVNAAITTRIVEHAGKSWVGSADGLHYRASGGAGDFERHPHYGFDGPLANHIAGLGADPGGTLWVATPGGLSARGEDGAWRLIRGKEGLPWKELTALDIDRFGRVWLGGTRGVILHDPANAERPWHYRAGERYLPDDHVLALAAAESGRSVIIETAAGFSRIDEEAVTLFEKARLFEERYNDRHRRLGLASPAYYDDAHAMESWVHGPQPSDGLWTGYHVTAAALAYSLSLDPAFRDSAAESMEALYLLQNVTGIEGLVARTLVSVDEPAAAQFRDADNYHLTADGKYLWRDDVSSDQLDGHFLAFYAYFEHIAQFDPDERARLEAQLRQVLDYILAHDDTIPDWNAKRTMWGWWTPELLNEHPIHFQEAGIYSLMMLMFLKTAYYITEDAQYAERYRELIEEHDFLSNILLEKKLFPDELNHSDDQLSAVAYYPILQLEHDPFIREALHRAARRHAVVEVPERNSFFAFVYATVDPDDADVAGGMRTMREFPRDRRNWRMENSHRRDIALVPDPNRSGNPVLAEVLPYDEFHFERWNQDPYEPDGGGDGRLAGSAEHYLLPYWIARYHGLIAPPAED